MLQQSDEQGRSFLKSLIPGKPIRWTDWLSVLSGASILAFIIYKAFTLGMLTDEAVTYEEFAKRGNFLFLSDGGNHVLNSFFIFFTSLAFPYSEFAIRLPNVIAGLLFLLVAYKLSYGKEWGFLYFILLAASWFLTDYFCMARGYGLAVAFILLAILALRRTGEGKEHRLALLSLYALILASFANFSAIVVLIVVVAELFITRFSRDLRNLVRKHYIDLIILLLLGMAALVGLYKVDSGNRLFANHELGFFEAMWGGLFTFYYDGAPVGRGWLIFSFAIYLGLFVLLHFRHAASLRTSRIFVGYLLAWLCLHIFMGRAFPSERTLLVALPLFAMSVIEVLEILWKQLTTTPAWLRIVPAVMAFVLLALNFGFQLDSGKYYHLESDLAFKSQEYALFHISPEQIDRSQAYFCTENPVKIFYQNKYGKSLYHRLKQTEPADMLDQDSLSASWYPDEKVVLVEMTRASNYSFWEYQPYLGLYPYSQDILWEVAPPTELVNIMRFHKPISLSDRLAWIFYIDREDVTGVYMAGPALGQWRVSPMMVLQP